MRTFRQKFLPALLALCLLVPTLASCKKETADPEDTTQNTVQSSEEVTQPEVTVPPIEENPSADGSTKVIYAVSGVGGSLDGSAEQTPGSSGTTQIKAVADLGYRFKSWSDGSTETSRKGDSAEEGTTKTIYAVFEMDCLELPVICLNTETGQDVDPRNGNKVYLGAEMSITNCSGDYAISDVSLQMRGRGNFSWHDVPKKSYKIKLSESQKLLGLGEGKSKTWCLLANHCDQSLIRNYLTYQLCRKLSGLAWAPDCTSVELYLNGEYRGVYLLIESIKVDEHRVAVSEDVETGTDIGYLLQMTKNSDEDYRFDSNGFNFDIKSDLSSNQETAWKQYAYISDYVNKCWSAVMGGDQEEIESLMDLSSLIDTYLVEEFNKNLDVGYDSFYLYKDAGGKLTFGPVWDFDLAFGNSDEHGCELPEDLYIAVDYCNHYHSSEWYTYLMSHDWFRAKVAERWKSKEVQDAFGSISDLATATAKAGYKSFCRNFDKWQIFGQKINRETWHITSLMSYTEHYEYLSTWIGDRFTWLNGFIGSEDYNKGELGGDDWGGGGWGGGGGWWPQPAPDYTFSGGKGSAESPYLIATVEDFANFSDALYFTDYKGKYFMQIADIDMDAVNGYTGMGSSGNFAGIYDGAGHKINANISSNDGCIFPYVSGVVMNLITTGSVTNRNQAAGLCRSVRTGGALINCASLMDVTSTGGNAGGLSPSTQSGDGAVIVNCYFAGSLNGAEQNSPINCWLDGRGGIFRYLYYSEKCDNGKLTVTDDDTRLTAAQIKNDLAAMLNANIEALKEVLDSYGISDSILCRWEKSGEYPVMAVKKVELPAELPAGQGNEAYGEISKEYTNLTKKSFEKLLADKSVQEFEYYDGGWGFWEGGQLFAEGPDNLFDGDTGTKLCTKAKAPFDVVWKMKSAVTAKAYVICTANDNAQYKGRNPQGWSLYGSTDGENWVLINQVTEGDLGDVNETAFGYKIDSGKQAAYTYFKFTVDVGSRADVLQISEIQLWG